MTAAADRRMAAVNEAPPADYWVDDAARNDCARVRARVGMSDPGYYEILLETAASDDECRHRVKALNDALYRADEYPLTADEIVADAARDLIRELRCIAARNEYEDLSDE